MVHAGIHTDLESLMALQQPASRLAAAGSRNLPRQYSGSHLSPLRGRGLDFDELKAYLPGDDIRHMDWRVTGRTGRPYIRSFNEEKERVVHLVLDQRVTMFFGSQIKMKSVIAAEACALLGWCGINSHDRVALSLFNDSEMMLGVPHRTRQHWYKSLASVEHFNRRLKVGINPVAEQLATCLTQLLLASPHQQIFYLISDLAGFNDEVAHLIGKLAQKNEIRLIFVLDPLEQHLPESERLAVTNGAEQLVVNTLKPKVAEAFSQTYEDKQQALLDLCQRSRSGRIGLLSLDTTRELTDQLGRLRARQ